MKRIIATALVAACAFVGVALAQATGSAGVAGYEVILRESALDSTAIKQVTASCPAGKRAVGAGWGVVNNTGAILDGQAVYSMPSYDGASWMVNARRLTPGTGPWRLQVRVICVSVG
jgi:hypothetical protein